MRVRDVNYLEAVMLHITLSPERRTNPEDDDLWRDRVGFSPTMSQIALYDANHGGWKLGARAHSERYYLATFEGIVRQAVEIESIEPAPNRPDRSVINGTILGPGHPVYEKYVGKPSPVQGVRNPITYFSDETPDARECRCGCGGQVTGKDFLPGHDQTALHERVKEIGTVADFLDWFDVVRGKRALEGTSRR